ncbi:hypothetical protein jhhlp_005889 [Lomentospora prolificans]|uniref:Apple domain-containing protein n=1 Tax=Lomentospora prolificans TaxID=41688 RepID=A0A2N3N4D2_9PEZI|nr:hypothetical protein jhhlp_005889 [Lomentospora prolificans]
MSRPEPNTDLQNSYGLEPAPAESSHAGFYAPQVSQTTSPLFTVSSPSHTPGTLATDATTTGDSAIAAEKKTTPEKKRILGLSVPVFWILVVLAFLVVLGIGIGVGLGVGLRHGGGSSSSDNEPVASSTPENDTTDTQTTDRSSEPSATATTTSAEPFVTSGTTGLAANSCTFQNPKTFTASDGTHFTQYCFTDWPRNSEASDSKGTVSDVARTIVYTFEDCMEECIKYNEDLADGATKCMAVTYNSNLTSIVQIGKQGGNCFLKNKKGVNLPGSAESASAAIAL